MPGTVTSFYHSEVTNMMTDTEAVEQTMYRYQRYYDDRRLNEVMELFTEDAVMSTANIDFRCEGREAIHQFLHAYLGMEEVAQGESAPPMAHCLVNPVIDVDGDTASAEADYFVLLWLDHDPHLAAMGRACYRMVRQADRWRIRELTMNVQVGKAASGLLQSRGYS